MRVKQANLGGIGCGVGAGEPCLRTWTCRAPGRVCRAMGSAVRPICRATLAAAKIGTTVDGARFPGHDDLPQSEALVQEHQYVGKAVWTRTVTLTKADCAHPAGLFL